MRSQGLLWQVAPPVLDTVLFLDEIIFTIERSTTLKTTKSCLACLPPSHAKSPTSSWRKNGLFRDQFRIRVNQWIFFLSGASWKVLSMRDPTILSLEKSLVQEWSWIPRETQRAAIRAALSQLWAVIKRAGGVIFSRFCCNYCLHATYFLINPTYIRPHWKNLSFQITSAKKNHGWLVRKFSIFWDFFVGINVVLHFFRT